MLEPLWGEPPLELRSKAGLSQKEKDALCNIPQAPLLEGPKLHQPETENILVKQECVGAGSQTSDILVTKSIELLRYRRQITRQLEIIALHKAHQATGANDLPAGEALPPIGQPPILPQAAAFQRTAKTTLFGFPLKEESTFKPIELPDITRKDAELGLRKAVIKISAHNGYQTAQDSAVRVLTEATELFLQTLTRKLRMELDRYLESNGKATGWTDILEKVFAEGGVGGVLDIQDYYEDSIIKYYYRLYSQCRDLEIRYRAEIPHQISGWQGNPDNIPEMHFPSSEEGAGLGDNLPNHATPTLDVGMQMLQSLEASGDLVDTPLSAADSVEPLSNMSCPTPSPALTPRTTSSVSAVAAAAVTSSPQLSSAKKRRRSGGKFM